jgi:hypothetical protein
MMKKNETDLLETAMRMKMPTKLSSYLLVWIVLLSVYGAETALAAEPGKPKPKVALTPETVAMQGVWKLDETVDNPVVMARLVVHGDYLLLIYQFPDCDATVIEFSGIRVDDRIRNAKGDPLVDYVFGEGRRLHVEIRDDRPDPISRLTEMTLVRTGRFPDLGL